MQASDCTPPPRNPIRPWVAARAFVRTFRDDDSRVRKDQAPKNFAVIKHMALNLLNKAKDKKSLRVMRKKAGWNNSFLLQILTA